MMAADTMHVTETSRSSQANSKTLTAANTESASSKAFDDQMKSRFVLRGSQPPAESTEDGIYQKKAENATTEVDKSVTVNKVQEKSLLNMVTHSLEGLDLLTELRGTYE